MIIVRLQVVFLFLFFASFTSGRHHDVKKHHRSHSRVLEETLEQLQRVAQAKRQALDQANQELSAREQALQTIKQELQQKKSEIVVFYETAGAGERSAVYLNREDAENRRNAVKTKPFPSKAAAESHLDHMYAPRLQAAHTAIVSQTVVVQTAQQELNAANAAVEQERLRLAAVEREQAERAERQRLAEAAFNKLYDDAFKASRAAIVKFHGSAGASLDTHKAQIIQCLKSCCDSHKGEPFAVDRIIRNTKAYANQQFFDLWNREDKRPNIGEEWPDATKFMAATCCGGVCQPDADIVNGKVCESKFGSGTPAEVKVFNDYRQMMRCPDVE